MPGTIRIGVVGAGANTRLYHIPNLQKIAGVEVVGVVNRSRESTERAARDFNIPRTYNHWQELIADPEIDAVVIGTWPYLHCPVTLAALAAGKHVLTEARIAMNAAEARQMLAAPTVKQLLAEGYLGEVQAVDLRVAGTWLDRDAPMNWRHDRDLSGNNTMFLGIWYECLMRWLGPATAVTARTRIAVPYRFDPARGERRAIEIPDHVEVLADFLGGAIAHMHLSAVAGLMPGPEVWLFGSEGTLRFEQPSGRLFGARRGEQSLSEIPIPPEKRSGWRVEEEFIAAIRGEAPVRLTTFEDGVRYMEFTDAVHISAREGRTVPLPLMP